MRVRGGGESLNSWDLQNAKFTRLDAGDGRLNHRRRGHNSTQFVCGELDHGNLSTAEVLLIPQILVSGKEQIEFTFGQL